MDPVKLRLIELGFGTIVVGHPTKSQFNKIKALGTKFTLEDIEPIVKILVGKIRIEVSINKCIEEFEKLYNIRFSKSKRVIKERFNLVSRNKPKDGDSPSNSVLLTEATKLIEDKLKVYGYHTLYGNGVRSNFLKQIAESNYKDISNYVSGKESKIAQIAVTVNVCLKALNKKDEVNVFLGDKNIFKLIQQCKGKTDPEHIVKVVKEYRDKVASSVVTPFDIVDKFWNKPKLDSGTQIKATVEKNAVKIPLTIPAIHKRLNAAVIGQDDAKRAIAHSIYVLGLLSTATKSASVRAIEVPNIILRGPSGSGKTLIANQVAKILGWKLIKVDCSQMSASGYYGGTISDVLKDLNNKVIFLDEVDKLIPAKQETGATTSTLSVQYELLIHLEKQYSNVNCLFIAAGSFANTELELIPELKGRLPVVCMLNKPTQEDFANGFKTYHLKKIKALANLISPTVATAFDDEIIDIIGNLAYMAAESDPIGYRALDSFTHLLSIQMTHDLSVGKVVVVNKNYVTNIFVTKTIKDDSDDKK